MTLSSLLLGKEVYIDKELDSLFQVPIAKTAIPGPSKTVNAKKRKLEIEKQITTEIPAKRVKPSAEEPQQLTSKLTGSKQPSKPEKANKAHKSTKPTKGKGKGVETSEELEIIHHNTPPSALEQRDEESSSDEEGDPSAMVHESVKTAGKKTSRPAKSKHVPENETPEHRNLRTIFVGNLPLKVASEKPLKKRLQRHILSFLPTAKIESIRFRSIPFQAPTSKLPTSDDENTKLKTSLSKKKDPRQHEKARASIWRTRLDEKDEEGLKNDEKHFLNPAQKKKIAFINQEFHSTADSVNAYVVFAHPPNTEGRPVNLPPLPPTMNPYKAARAAAEKCDGTLFAERMIRVDLVEKNDVLPELEEAAENARRVSTLGSDPRLSVFVGNLDFASKEEDLRVFFEGIINEERGRPPVTLENEGGTVNEIESSAKKPTTWVTRVRIIRDKDTQLGKGFAYVHFLDRECVDELLALEESKLKFAKRKLRIQRCKTIPEVRGQITVPVQKKRTPVPVAVSAPKGDPNLGERLAGLSKGERKQVKSSDADRVARRLAKKKARMAMTPRKAGSKFSGKERKRVRS